MYEVATIGDLTGPLKGERWLDMPPGWVPPGTPPLSDGHGGFTPAPVPGPPRPPPSSTTLDGGALTVVAVGGVVAGALGLWLYGRYAAKRR